MLQNGHILDIDVDELSEELELLQMDLLIENNTANTIRNFLQMVDTYLVSCLTYTILLNVSITIISTQKKLFKTKSFKILFLIDHVSRVIKHFDFNFS